MLRCHLCIILESLSFIWECLSNSLLIGPELFVFKMYSLKVGFLSGRSGGVYLDRSSLILYWIVIKVKSVKPMAALMPLDFSSGIDSRELLGTSRKSTT